MKTLALQSIRLAEKLCEGTVIEGTLQLVKKQEEKLLGWG